MKNREVKAKGAPVKLIKKVTPNKAKLAVRKEAGKKEVVDQSVAMTCVPLQMY